MNAITVRLPDDLIAALSVASRQPGLSKSAVVREALKQSLLAQSEASGVAERWIMRWQGKLKLPDPPGLGVARCRLSHLLAKHAR